MFARTLIMCMHQIFVLFVSVTHISFFIVLSSAEVKCLGSTGSSSVEIDLFLNEGTCKLDTSLNNLHC